MSTETPKDSCCPEFNPSPWEDKLLEWYNKPFVKDQVFTLFYMPLNFGKVMKRMNKLIASSGAAIPDWLCLSDHTSQWNMDLYLAVDKPVNGAANTALSGKFYSRMYEGPFKNTGKWCKEFGEAAKAKGFNVKKLYLWYTTCPKCAKKFGKNWVVIIGQVEG